MLFRSAAARTARAGGDIVAGYRLSFLVGAGMGVLAMALAAAQVRSRIRQREPEELAAAAEPAQIGYGSSYLTGVLPGVLLTALSIGLTLPAASVAITTGVHGRDQGIAGAMFVTGQQAGAAVGLAVLATAAAARTAHAGGDIVAGYSLSFLIGAGMGVLAIALAAAQVRSRPRPREPEKLAAPEPARD